MASALTMQPVKAHALVSTALVNAVNNNAPATRAAAGDTFTQDDFKYTVNSDGTSVSVTKYTGSAAEVVIPGEVTNSTDGTKYTVDAIGDNAFYDNEKLTSISIPASVKSIGHLAFFCCYGLASVSFADECNLETIGYGAFVRCQSLTSISIPASVKSIGEGAFQQCLQLKEVIVKGKTPAELGSGAFYDIDNDAVIYVPKGTVDTYKEKWSDYKDIIQGAKAPAFNAGDFTYEVNEESNTVILSAYKGTEANVVIPEKVTNNGTEYTVESIGTKAFYDNEALTSITIPASVTSIGENALYGCSKLNSITFEEGSKLQKIEDLAIYGTALTSITIPASVTYIGEYGIAQNEDLKEVIFEGKTPAKLGRYAFRYDADNQAIFYVPIGSVDTYKAAWSDYADRIQGNTNTGIKEILTIDQKYGVKSGIYTLDGRYVKVSENLKNLAKGVYIVNGKKVVVK